MPNSEGESLFSENLPDYCHDFDMGFQKNNIKSRNKIVDFLRKFEKIVGKKSSSNK
jgi:hypothetical protein